MALKKHNFNLPFNIQRCSHVHCTVKDLDASRKFYVDIMGFVETERTKDTLYLRGLEEKSHHCYVLEQGEKAEVLALGFKVAFDKDLDALAQHFKMLGLSFEWVQRHAEERTLAVSTPLGLPLEFHARQTRVPTMMRDYIQYKGLSPLRFDHINCFTPNCQTTYEFMIEQLGFRLTEYTLTEKGDMWAAWTHRKGNVHDMALTNGRGPRLHHTGIWTASVNNIIHLLDVMASQGYVENIERGPGRHGVSNAFFLYILDPDGHRLEPFTCDYLTIDTDWEPLGWDLRDPRRQTLWGAPAPKSWFEHGTPFKGVEVRDSDIDSDPIVAGYEDIA